MKCEEGAVVKIELSETKEGTTILKEVM